MPPATVTLAVTGASGAPYSLRLLGEDPFTMAAVGDDFGPYSQHLEALGISQRYIRHMEGEFTPQAFITTDIDDNQITAFHPGAMQFSYLNRVADTDGITLGIVAPDGKLAMIQHSRDFVACGIPHIFDPGQAMTLFDGEEFRRFIEEAKYIIVNDYEFQLLKEKSGLNGDEIANQVEAMVVTRGAEGSILRTREDEIEIEPTEPDDVQDEVHTGGLGGADGAGQRGVVTERQQRVPGRGPLQGEHDPLFGAVDQFNDHRKLFGDQQHQRRQQQHRHDPDIQVGPACF